MTPNGIKLGNLALSSAALHNQAYVSCTVSTTLRRLRSANVKVLSVNDHFLLSFEGNFMILPSR
jgi:hypothetical protein